MLFLKPNGGTVSFMDCLFCKSDGPYSTVEHIIPESLGNKHLLLREQVYDKCQGYFGKEIEQYVLRRSPLGFWRVHAGVPTKHGKPPKYSFGQPTRDKGIFPDRSPSNDDSLELFIDEDGDRRFHIKDDRKLDRLESGETTTFRLTLTPKMLHMMGRMLGKIGLEMLARDHPDVARSTRFDAIRQFARFGQPTGFLWPLFYHGSGSPI